MRRYLWTGLAMASFCASMAFEVKAQPLPISIRLLGQPADALCLAASKKPVTLPEFAKLVEKYHKLKVVIDEQAFQRDAPQVDLAKTKFLLLVDRGLRLSTVLHYVLEEELPVRATYKIGNQSILIHPGVTQVLQEEDLNSPMGKRLKASVVLSPTGFNGLLAEVLGKIQGGTGLVFLVAKRKFAETGDQENILLKQVKVPPQAKAPATQTLQQVLDQVNARYQVKYDHLLIVPKGKGR